MPQLRSGDFQHDRKLYAYFNEKADGSALSAGALVAHERILWEAPAEARKCVRQRLAGSAKDAMSRIPQLVGECKSGLDENFVAMSISGGGHKSKVFALSVMEELDRHYGVLDDVDAISSASGGSFAALIYALSCDSARCDPETERWRKQWNPSNGNSDIEGLKSRNVLWPFVFKRLRPDHLFLNATTYHDSGESFHDVLRSEMFDNKPDVTFAELNADRPNLFITATNLSSNRSKLLQLSSHGLRGADRTAFEMLQRSTAQHFSFSSRYFEQLGSNLETYSLVKALVASAAFPIIIDPTTLRNYRDPLSGACKDWYGPSNCESFVHLTDGGVHDNVAVSEFQWFLECIFQDSLPGKLRAGAIEKACSELRSTKKPKAVFSFVIDVSLSASQGRDSEKAEQRLSPLGIPIRIGSTSGVVDMISLSNTTQRKVELAGLTQELRHGSTEAAMVDFGLEVLNDLECIESDRCENWLRAKAFACSFGRVLEVPNGSFGSFLRQLLARVKDVDVSFELSSDDREALGEVAPWIVARKLADLEESGMLSKLSTRRSRKC